MSLLERLLKNPNYYKDIERNFTRILKSLVPKGNLPVINYLYLNYGDFFSQLAKNEYKSSKLILEVINYGYPEIAEILLVYIKFTSSEFNQRTGSLNSLLKTLAMD